MDPRFRGSDDGRADVTLNKDHPMPLTHLTAGRLTAAIASTGAELRSFTLDGQERMTPATPDHWQGHAPLLFPVIGRVADDTIRVDGRAYPMLKHGLARHAEFERVAQDGASAQFRLASSAETRMHYPFDWTLNVRHALSDRLETTVAVTNRGDGPMPYSFGFHPAFAWPQPGGERERSAIAFAEEEPGDLLRLTPDGLIAPGRRASPLDGRTLHLADGLFTDDALIWSPVASRSVRYGGLTVRFPDSDTLAVWTQPGAGFVCIEPWSGHADPEGFSGEMRDKPGARMLAAGEAAEFRLVIRPEL